MDTRDFLAGQTVNALIQGGEGYGKDKEIKKLAALAYRIADAMLEERDHPAHSLANKNSLIKSASDSVIDKEKKKSAEKTGLPAAEGPPKITL